MEPTILALLITGGLALAMVFGGAYCAKKGFDLYQTGIGLVRDGLDTALKGEGWSAKLTPRTVGSVVMLTSVLWLGGAVITAPDLRTSEGAEVASLQPSRTLEPSEDEQTALALARQQLNEFREENESIRRLVAIQVAEQTREISALSENLEERLKKISEGLPKNQKDTTRVSWKLASMFPSDLVPLGSLGRELSERVEQISLGNMELEFYEPSVLVLPFDTFDAVSSGKIQAAWSSPSYWTGKEKALGMFGSVPFGPKPLELMAWIFHGGGNSLLDEIYAKFDLKSVICGIVGPASAGWFRNEITSINDLKGLNIRITGLGAEVMARLGASVATLPGGEIYTALEKGAIDATEFSMPAIDGDLGFYRFAKHSYFPGWHQQSMLLELLVNRNAWNALSASQKSIIETTCGNNMRDSLAVSEAIQPEAIAELQAKGVTFLTWPPDITRGMQEAWKQVAEQEAASDPVFKKVFNSYSAFRQKYKTWRGLAYAD